MVIGPDNGHPNAFVARIPAAVAGGVPQVTATTVNIALASGGIGGHGT